MKKLGIVGLLCTVITFVVFNNLLAQDRPIRVRGDWSFWKGPDIGSVISDFERTMYSGKTFRLSDHRGKILVLEMGACT